MTCFPFSSVSNIEENDFFFADRFGKGRYIDNGGRLHLQFRRAPSGDPTYEIAVYVPKADGLKHSDHPLGILIAFSGSNNLAFRVHHPGSPRTNSRLVHRHVYRAWNVGRVELPLIAPVDHDGARLD